MVAICPIPFVSYTVSVHVSPSTFSPKLGTGMHDNRCRIMAKLSRYWLVIVKCIYLVECSFLTVKN